MSRTPVRLIGTLRVSFSFYLSPYYCTSTSTKLGVAGIATTTSSHKLSVKRLVDIGHHRFKVSSLSFPNNKLYTKSLVVPTALSLSAASYLISIGKLIYCTENKVVETFESTSKTTLHSSQPSSQSNSKEKIIPSLKEEEDKRPFSLFDIFNLQQITFGTSMGFASGYFVKKISKTAAVLVGAIFVLLQILEHQGYITIYWSKFEENYNKVLDLDKDGKITTNDFKLIFHKAVNFLSRNFQTDAGFVIGFGVGLRYG